jgi:hypothetical protein
MSRNYDSMAELPFGDESTRDGHNGAFIEGQAVWQGLSAADRRGLLALFEQSHTPPTARSEAANTDRRSPTMQSTPYSNASQRRQSAQGTHTPRTLATAQLLAELPLMHQGGHLAPPAEAVDVVQGAPNFLSTSERGPAPPAGDARGPQGRQQVTVGGRSNAPSRHPTLDDLSQRQLNSIEASIARCMSLIDCAKSEAPESSKHQELMQRVAQLDARIRAQQRATRTSAIPATSQARDAPSRTRNLEMLLRAASDARRDPGPLRTTTHSRREQRGRVAGSEIEHHSVSEAQFSGAPLTHRDSHCGMSQVAVQEIVAHTVQACMRNMHSLRAPRVRPQVDDHRDSYAREPYAAAPVAQRAPHGRTSQQEPVAPRGAHSSWLNRELRLPKFRGETGENPLDFLTKFERFAAALPHLTLDLACRQCMPLALTDEAEQWLIAESKRLPLDYSYLDFSRALVDRFLPHDYVDRMRRFLETRMQGENETLAKFITVIETAYERMGVRASEREVVQRIGSQLNPTYNQLIGHRYFGTVDELSKHARAIDAQVHRQKSFQQIEADCPDADLKVRSTPPKPLSKFPPTQLVGGGVHRRSSEAGSDEGTTHERKDYVDSKSQVAKEDPDGEEISKLRLCYLCDDPSHLANKCPMRSDSAKGKHGAKNGDAPSSRS